MKIIVNHICGPVIKKMHDAGWRAYEIFDELGHEKTADNLRRRNNLRRICGLEMAKDFDSFGDAIRDFEAITGYDAIEDQDQSGGFIYWFKCRETEICVGGWECGRYLYKNWTKTPREALVRLDEVLEKDGGR